MTYAQSAQSIAPVATMAPSMQTAAQLGSQPLQNDFSKWFEKELAEVNGQLLAGDDWVRKLALGEVDNIHRVMIELEKAKLSFTLALHVRNRLLEGYQEIQRMQL